MSVPLSSPDAPAKPHPLQREVDALRERLAEAEVVVKSVSGAQVYTLLNADRPYRNIVERMQEGALTLTPDGTVLYANQRLASFLGLPLPSIVGQKFGQFIAADDRDLFIELLAEGRPAGNDFILKPFDRAELVGRLNHWTRRRINKGW
jgi:PAS domain-containing protein